MTVIGMGKREGHGVQMVKNTCRWVRVGALVQMSKEKSAMEQTGRGCKLI